MVRVEFLGPIKKEPLEVAANSLADALPNMVDKATPEGESLLDQVGGLDGLMNMAGKLFGKS